MESRGQLPTITIIEVRNLENVGFSSEQIASLFSMKVQFLRSAYDGPTPEHKRLEFVRWLYQQGRLQS